MRIGLVSVWARVGLGATFCVLTQVSVAQGNRDTLNAQQAAAAQVAQQQIAGSTGSADTQHVIAVPNTNTHKPDGIATDKSFTTPGGAPRIGAEKDLPHIRYPLHESASSLVVADNADFNSFLSHYAPDLNTLLGGFSIENKELLLRLLQAQEDAAILSGDRKAAEAALEKQRDLETTQTEKALLGLSDYAFLHAWKKAGAENGDGFQKAYADDYAHRLNSLPWGAVGVQIKAMAAQCGSSQPAPEMEYVKVHLDPEAATIHAVTLGQADRIVLARKALQFDQATQAPRCAILAAYVGSHTTP